MKEHYKCLVFYNGELQELQNVLRETDKLPESFEVLIVAESPVLEGRVIMPFIEIDPPGNRYHGLKSIKRKIDRIISEESPGLFSR